jgi:predicted amidohydrolase
MQDLRITTVQSNQIWEDKPANLARYESLIENIAATDLIVFPEMFHTGFSMNVDALAETMENSLGINWLKNCAKTNNCAVYTSLIIEENNAFYNRGVFIEPTGKLSFYDKRKCFSLAHEDDFFTAGQNEIIVEYNSWKLQLQICYDLRFPEIVRNRIEGNIPAYDVILYVANWPKKRAEHWKALLKARAIENQCYVVGVNRVGDDGNGIKHNGHSQLIDFSGENRVTPIENREQIVHVLIEKVPMVQFRERFPFLKDQ